MEKHLGKDPEAYEKEYESFLVDLKRFHASKGTPITRLPSFDRKELDLYLLYSKVTSMGGFAKVTDDYRWEDLLDVFDIPRNCSQAAFAVRQFYLRYLELYERINHFGEDTEEVLHTGGSRPSTPISGVSSNYHSYSQRKQEIPDAIRQSSGLSMDKATLTDYDKLVQSLECGLPNEIDFSINVCTLLSNESRHVLRLEKTPAIVDLLLSHIGIFSEGVNSYAELYSEEWQPRSSRDYIQFWYDTIHDTTIQDIIEPNSTKKRNTCYHEVLCRTSRTLGVNDTEGQRILQIAIILRNLSFEKHNIPVLSTNSQLFRFLLLCAHNSCSSLKQLGLDTLGNIASQILLDPIDFRSTQLVFHTICKCLRDKDKFAMIRGMEILGKITHQEDNIDIICAHLEPNLYTDIVSVLTIQDIQLLLGALEVLYQLSELGEVACENIADVHKCVDILVCLVTLDANSLGADAFVGVKVVEHAPIDSLHAAMMSSAPVVRPQPQITPPPSVMSTAVASPAQLPQHTRQNTVPNLVAAPPPQGTREIDSETFTCQWLNASYEVFSDASVSRIDLYADYLAACSKLARMGILTSTNFAKCVRLVFPHAGNKRIEMETGHIQYHMVGIRKRPVPLPIHTHIQQQQQQQQQQQRQQTAIYPGRPATPPRSSVPVTLLPRAHNPNIPSPSVTPSPPPPSRLLTPQSALQQRTQQMIGQQQRVQTTFPGNRPIMGVEAPAQQQMMLSQQQQQMQRMRILQQQQQQNNTTALQSGQPQQMTQRPTSLPDSMRKVSQTPAQQVLIQRAGVLPFPQERSPSPSSLSGQAPSPHLSPGVSPTATSPPPLPGSENPGEQQSTPRTAPSGGILQQQLQTSHQNPGQMIQEPALALPNQQRFPSSIQEALLSPAPSPSPTLSKALPQPSHISVPTSSNPSAAYCNTNQQRTATLQSTDSPLIKQLLQQKAHQTSSSEHYGRPPPPYPSQTQQQTIAQQHYQQQQYQTGVQQQPQMIQQQPQMIQQQPQMIQQQAQIMQQQQTQIMQQPQMMQQQPQMMQQQQTQIVQQQTQIVQQQPQIMQQQPQMMQQQQPKMVQQPQMMQQQQPQIVQQPQMMQQSQILPQQQPQIMQQQQTKMVQQQPQMMQQQPQMMQQQPQMMQQQPQMMQQQPQMMQQQAMQQRQVQIVHQPQPQMQQNMVPQQRQQQHIKQNIMPKPNLTQQLPQGMQQQQQQQQQQWSAASQPSNTQQWNYQQQPQPQPQQQNWQQSTAPNTSTTTTYQQNTVQYANRQPTPPNFPSSQPNVTYQDQSAQNIPAQLRTTEQNIAAQQKTNNPNVAASQQWQQRQQPAAQNQWHNTTWPASPQTPPPSVPQSPVRTKPPPYKAQSPKRGQSTGRTTPSKKMSPRSGSPRSLSPRSVDSTTMICGKEEQAKDVIGTVIQLEDKEQTIELVENTAAIQDKENVETPMVVNAAPENNVEIKKDEVKVNSVDSIKSGKVESDEMSISLCLEDTEHTIELVENKAVVEGKQPEVKNDEEESMEIDEDDDDDNVDDDDDDDESDGDENMDDDDDSDSECDGEKKNAMATETKQNSPKDRPNVMKSDSSLTNNSTTENAIIVNGPKVDDKTEVEKIPAVTKDIVKEVLSKTLNKDTIVNGYCDGDKLRISATNTDVIVGRVENTTKDIQHKGQGDFQENDKCNEVQKDGKEMQENGHIEQNGINASGCPSPVNGKNNIPATKAKQVNQNTFYRDIREHLPITTQLPPQSTNQVASTPALQPQGANQAPISNTPANHNVSSQAQVSNPAANQNATLAANQTLVSNNRDTLSQGNTIQPSNDGQSQASQHANQPGVNNSTPGQKLINYESTNTQSNQGKTKPIKRTSDEKTESPLPTKINAIEDKTVKQENLNKMSVVSIEQQQPQTQPVKQPTPASTPPTTEAKKPHSIYVCGWLNCDRVLDSLKGLYSHVCHSHGCKDYQGVCLWDGCDRIRRQRWSCISHIQEKHCNERALMEAAAKRAEQAARGVQTNEQQPGQSSQPLVYNAHTAFHAIRRSLNVPTLKELLGENEGPVTKSIRITSALILKNLVRHSSTARRQVLRYERHLANLALNNLEAALTVSKCLGELHQQIDLENQHHKMFTRR
ncbi:uncharacterized protein LOC144452899 [Glandiceps talaboti]